MLIRVLEDLDDSLNITQLIKDDLNEKMMPEYDVLYSEKKEEVKKAEEMKTEEASEDNTDVDADGVSETPMEGGEDTSADGVIEDPDMQVINQRNTTVAMEKIRNDDHYNRIVIEAFDNGESSVVKNALHAAGGLAWTGVTRLSAYGLHVATELAGFLKDMGVSYGPVVFRKLKVGVMYLLTRLFKSFSTMQSVAVKELFQKANSFKKHKQRLQRLRQTLELLADDVEISQKEPFQNDSFYKWMEINGKASPLDSMKAISSLMEVVVSDIDHGVRSEVETLQRLIEVTKRGVRTNLDGFIQISNLTGNFKKTSVQGYENDASRMDMFVYNHALPASSRLIFSLPVPSVIKKFAQEGNMDEVTKSYQDSYIIIGVNPIKPKTSSMINYMDKKSLLAFLAGLEVICNKGLQHVSFYKSIETHALSLKADYQKYFSWLTGDDHAKSLKEAMVELIYLKQSFVTRVYMPGAVDIHDFVSSYLGTMFHYVESNIKVLKPKEELAD